MNADVDVGNLILTHDKMDLPSSAEAILSALRGILAKPFVQKVVLDSEGFMDVSWYRAPTDSLEIGPVDEDPDVTLSRIDLRESSYQESPPKENLVDCFTELSILGLVPTHLICSNEKEFKKWVGLPHLVVLPKRAEFSYYLGLKIIESDTLPECTVVLGAAKVYSDALTDVQEGIKLIMENCNDS